MGFPSCSRSAPSSVLLTLSTTSIGILFHLSLLPLVFSAFLSLLIPSAHQYGFLLAPAPSNNCPFSLLFSSARSLFLAATMSLKLHSTTVASDYLRGKSKGMFFISYLYSSFCILLYLSAFLLRSSSFARSILVPVLKGSAFQPSSFLLALPTFLQGRHPLT